MIKIALEQDSEGECYMYSGVVRTLNLNRWIKFESKRKNKYFRRRQN